MTESHDAWPALLLASWRDSCETLHLWTQIVGKIKLAQAPFANHWWQVPLYVTARGLTTSLIPYKARSFQIDFDFIDHRLSILESDGRRESLSLAPCSVARFYREVMERLRSLGIEVAIWTMPVEIPDAIPFEGDERHGSYDPEYVGSFWRILVQCNRLFSHFRSGFLGKVSPVHFFWGSFDLAITRFSGRRAPPHPGGAPNLANWVMQEAYSHEVSSCGFWPGSGAVAEPAFYAYAYPQPAGFAEYRVQPSAAFYHRDIGEFLLPYDKVREAASPDEFVISFLQSTYVAAAELGGWDRAALERPAS